MKTKVWERYALLTRLKNIVFAGTELENKRIVNAPPKKVLTVFGGDKTIDEFRCDRISVPKKYINLLSLCVVDILIIPLLSCNKLYNHAKSFRVKYQIIVFHFIPLLNIRNPL